MTNTARKVLHDLCVAHALLESEEDLDRFRVLWVASVALARSVGHVLQKVDSTASTRLKTAISDSYLSWKSKPEQNVIFFEFIEDERNAVLKEYEFGFMSGAVGVVVVPEGAVATLDENLFCPLSCGKFAGEDCRDVLALAIEWWRFQLEEIDRVVADLSVENDSLVIRTPTHAKRAGWDEPAKAIGQMQTAQGNKLVMGEFINESDQDKV